MEEQKDELKWRRFLETVAGALSDYAVGFVKLWEKEKFEQGDLAGSGTLVAINNTRAILTADHVIDALPERGEVGLVLPSRFNMTLHRFTLQMESVRRVQIGRGSDESKGPDLGLLILAPADIAKFPSHKTFYNLSKRSMRMLAKPPAIDEGAWLLSGMADEWTTDEGPERGHENVKIFQGLHGAGLITSERTDEEYDYLVFEAKYGEGYEGPESYKGFSGGGLWQILVEKTGDEIQMTDGLLSGVAFYQSDKEGDFRWITCHGRKSIYRAAVSAMQS